MHTTMLIFFGAGLGGALRYWVSEFIHHFLGKAFPYGTFVVNVSGCFLMGLLFALTLERFDSTSSELRAFLLIGFLGGYTTFSSFSIETLKLIENGNWNSAVINIIISNVVCLSAAWLGIMGGRILPLNISLQS